jgi:hypothetical protein
LFFFPFPEIVLAHFLSCYGFAFSGGGQIILFVSGVTISRFFWKRDPWISFCSDLQVLLSILFSLGGNFFPAGLTPSPPLNSA